MRICCAPSGGCAGARVVSGSGAGAARRAGNARASFIWRFRYGKRSNKPLAETVGGAPAGGIKGKTMFNLRFAAGAAAMMLLGGPAMAVPVQWSSGAGGNDHWYDLVASPGDFSHAVTSAAGQSYLGLTGYLATITSQAELDFLILSVNPGAAPVWLGGSDAASEGTWTWITGPEAGEVFWIGNASGSSPTFANWNGGEPNDLGGEDGLVGWAIGPVWNDAFVGSSVGSYLVEFSAPESAGAQVPLPAALPLMLGGIGGLALLRRRRG